MKSTCISCQSNNVIQLLDFGVQPPSNRFLNKEESALEKHPLMLGMCNSCNHIQLLNPMSVEMVRSRFNWVSYNEPEGHLDDVVSKLTALPGITSESSIIGVSYKEDTTLERLKKQGFHNLYRLRPETDFLIPPDSGIEVIQEHITPETARAIAAKRCPADILYARHILEHAHNPDIFTHALKLLVKEGGYLVFEIPDSEKFMRHLDYPFIWEEHISYFIEKSLEQFVRIQNLEIIDLYRYEYTFEDVLVVITKVNNVVSYTEPNNKVDNYIANLTHNFAIKLPVFKDGIRQVLMEYINTGKKIGIFGAGHLATKYLNFFELTGIVEMVLDDNPHKQGLFMPGSRIPIADSSNLKQINLCLLSLSPESEKKVLEKYHPYVENGCEFRSIFAGSPISIFNTSCI